MYVQARLVVPEPLVYILLILPYFTTVNYDGGKLPVIYHVN